MTRRARCRMSSTYLSTERLWPRNRRLARRRPGARPQRRLRLGEAGEFGVGRREEDDVAGCLAEIDGLAAVRNSARFGGEEMHR